MTGGGSDGERSSGKFDRGSAVENDAETAIIAVGDDEFAGGVEEEPGGRGELGGNSEAAIAPDARKSRTGVGGDCSRSVDAAYAVAGELGDVDVAGGIDGDPGRLI